MSTLKEREQAARKVTLFGMMINFILVLFKIFAGIFGHSSALIADAIHSLSDFVTDIIVIVGFRFTSKPADEDHNYGHGKVETVSAVLIGITLFFLGTYLLVTSGISVFDYFFNKKEIVTPQVYVLIAIVASIGLKEMLFHVTHMVGKRIKSDAVIANAWHHRSDAFSSIAALIGVLMAVTLGASFAVCDPIASVVVSIFILKVGFEILSSNYKQLIDSSLSHEEVIKIEEIIKNTEDLLGFHNLKTRKIGYCISIEVHIFVDKSLNVEAAHAIASLLEQRIFNEFGKDTHISVHIEPFYENYPVLT